ncbi:MAG: sigma-70 family RNA polymerase sigma factor [Acidobacteriota bacterium]|nr:sigma-70 family RNA polymerase sigma factor [Acidobacteriota bacterium]
MNEAADLEDVRRCLAGETGAFEGIIRRYQRPVLNLAYRIVRNHEDARDVVQSVFVKVYERLASYDSRFKFFSWLYRIAVNESLNLAEKRDRRIPPPSAWMSGESNPADAAAAEELTRRIEATLAGLAPGQRALLAMSADGLTYREMGDALGLPEPTIKSRLFAARDKLRGLIGREGRPAHDR